MRYLQPIQRKSTDAVWPLRRADGTPFWKNPEQAKGK